MITFWSGARRAALLAALFPVAALAQHAHPSDTTHAAHGAHAEGVAPVGAHGGAHASSALVPSAPMSGDGSGTSWLPTASPMEMAHAEAAGWALMVHGAAFPRVTSQDVFDSGARGATALSLPNWVMGMAQRPLSASTQLTLRGMVSADPLLEGGRGYPLLFQTGETYDGERLVDRQHPHDLVAELSATVAARLGEDVSAFAYAAYPGEPAIGPTAFMHRPSARFLPDAPLSHHWQDATHVVWGVATGGVVAGPVKLDASVFTGAEPDEDRYAPDTPRFDSYSGRLSVAPSERWSLQVSRAFLREPEAAEPGEDQWRTTASVLYAAPVGADGDLTASLAWGRNAHVDGLEEDPLDDHHDAQHAVLAESTLRLGPWAAFGRAEVTEKSDAELGLSEEETVHRLGALTLGGARRLARVGGIETMLGVQATAYAVPDGLASTYGTAPISAQIFLRLSPSAMRMGM